MSRGWTVGKEGSSQDGFSYDYRGQPSERTDIAAPKAAVPFEGKTGVAAASKGGGSVAQGASPRQSAGPSAGQAIAGSVATKGPGSPVAKTDGPGQTGVGPGNGAANTGGAATASSGPGNPAVKTAPVGAQRAIPLPFNLTLFPDEKYVDVEDFWEPRYGEPGEWIGGIVNFGVDAGKAVNDAVDDLNPRSPVGFVRDMFNNTVSGTTGQPGWSVLDGLIFGTTIADAWDVGVSRTSGPMPKQEPVDWGR